MKKLQSVWNQKRHCLIKDDTSKVIDLQSRKLKVESRRRNDDFAYWDVGSPSRIQMQHIDHEIELAVPA